MQVREEEEATTKNRSFPPPSDSPFFAAAKPRGERGKLPPPRDQILTMRWRTGGGGKGGN